MKTCIGMKITVRIPLPLAPSHQGRGNMFGTTILSPSLEGRG